MPINNSVLDATNYRFEDDTTHLRVEVIAVNGNELAMLR